MLQGTLTDAVRLHRAGLQLLHTDTAATIQVGRHLTKVTDVVVISHARRRRRSQCATAAIGQLQCSSRDDVSRIDVVGQPCGDKPRFSRGRHKRTKTANTPFLLRG